MSCIASSEEIIAFTKGLHIDCYDGETHRIISISNKSLQNDDKICDIAISSDSKYLAVITTTSKRLIIYYLPTLKEERVFVMPRSASKIRFNVDNTKILLADKTGDGLIYNISTENTGTKLFGQLSLLLNILQSLDEKYIITSDRDEKIRVTCYPNTYSIHTYCLGHKEFVNNIEFLPHNVKCLVSTSGDATIKIWDYEKGEVCHTINTYLDINDDNLQEEFKKHMVGEGIEVEHLPIVLFTIMKLNDSCSIIAVCVHLVKKIYIYSLESNNNVFIHKLIYTLDVYDLPNAIQFHKCALFVYFTSCEVLEYEVTIHNLQLAVNSHKKIEVFKNIDVDINTSISSQNSIKVLYKRKFDNVQEYQERKKQRLGTVV